MRAPERTSRIVMVAALAAATGACTPLDNALAAVPFFAFMREAPSFDPYEAPRPAPPNAVPFNSPAGESLLMHGNSEAELNAFAAGPHGANPLVVDSAVLALGAEMYARHCAVCHGPAGQGDGTIVGQGKYPSLAPNLTLPATVARPDGYLYAIIRVGRGIMPSYGGRTTHEERWAIVNHIRRLQQAQGGAAPPQPAPAPAADTAAPAAGAPADTTGDR